MVVLHQVDAGPGRHLAREAHGHAVPVGVVAVGADLHGEAVRAVEVRGPGPRPGRPALLQRRAALAGQVRRVHVLEHAPPAARGAVQAQARRAPLPHEHGQEVRRHPAESGRPRRRLVGGGPGPGAGGHGCDGAEAGRGRGGRGAVAMADAAAGAGAGAGGDPRNLPALRDPSHPAPKRNRNSSSLHSPGHQVGT